MEKLIGAAKEEDEDEFWAEHADYFQSSEEDDEFDEEDSDIGEEEREDSEDSDIDEDENEVDSDAEAAEAEKAVKRQARSGGRKGVYQDPALRRRRAATTMPRQKRAVEIDPSETIAARKEKRQATGAAEERRKEMRAAEARKKKPVRKPVVVERKLTAQEMFTEAARTEVINKASLDRLLELEEEKRKEVIRKRVIVGPRVKFLSRSVPSDPNNPASVRTKNAITFTDVTELKVADNKPLASGFGTARRPTVCVITKHPAKYVDPLTNLPYSDLAAFKAIRAKVARGEIELPAWKLEKAGLKPNGTRKAEK